MELFRNKPGALANIAVTLLGALYVAFSLGSFVGIRELFVPADFPVYAHFTVPGPAVPEEIAAQIYRWGGFTVLSIFGAIWVCDSAAYFAGRAFGRHKLFLPGESEQDMGGGNCGMCCSRPCLRSASKAVPAVSFNA